MTTHILKCHPEPFEAVRAGDKVHEVRKADRNFQPGDFVKLVEWDPIQATCTGRSIYAMIGHVSRPGTWGLPAGLCVFSLLHL